MSKRPESSSVKPGRDDRLKAALRANLARRKAQGRARAAADDGPATENAATETPGSPTPPPKKES